MHINLRGIGVSSRSKHFVGAVLATLTVVAGVSEPMAHAGSGGVEPPDSGHKRPSTGRDGGVGMNAHRGDHDAPVLREFRLSPKTVVDATQGTTVKFRIYDRTSQTVRVKLAVIDLQTGRAVRHLNVGRVRSKRQISYQLQIEGLVQGRYRVRITARDRVGHQLKRRAGISSIGRFSYLTHRFPILGAHDYGGPDARFGAERPGHIHQGQDLLAATGTPLVAPSPGTIKYVDYQASGAGYYVVLSAPDDDRDYVFMHMRKGSLAVHQGQAVSIGDRLGEVGATGDASGPHLHFEVWEGGGWYTGGHPVDPLPILRSWEP